MNKKSSDIHMGRSVQSAHMVLKAARFVGMTAGIPIGIIKDIRSGLEKVFNPMIMRYESPQRITQLEKRLAELEQRIHEFDSLSMPFSEEFSRTTKQTKAINGLAICDPERRVLNAIFRYNLKLQKPKLGVK